MGETTNPAEAPQQQSDARPQSLLIRAALRIFGWVSSAVVRLLGATWRVEILGDDPRQLHMTQARGGVGTGAEPDPRPARLAGLFHESMVPCAWFFRDREYSVAISRSPDGDLVAASLRSLGYSDPPRGSSSRGGSAALRGLLRALEGGTTVSVLVDGPRGPVRVAKTGIVTLARLSQQTIYPVAFSARPAIRLDSWDRSLIPLPFARVVCAFGPPVEVSTDTDEIHEQAAARRLEHALNQLHYAADHRLLERHRRS